MNSPLPLAEVEAHLSELIHRVNTQHERVTVTVHGKPSAILLAPEDLEFLEETIAVLSDRRAMEGLRDSDDELSAGRGESEAVLATAMSRRVRRGS